MGDRVGLAPTLAQQPGTGAARNALHMIAPSSHLQHGPYSQGSNIYPSLVNKKCFFCNIRVVRLYKKAGELKAVHVGWEERKVGAEDERWVPLVSLDPTSGARPGSMGPGAPTEQEGAAPERVGVGRGQGVVLGNTPAACWKRQRDPQR